MPNWVRNKIMVGKKETLEKLLSRYCLKDKDGNEELDFNRIRKMPKEVNIECSSRSMDGIRLCLAKKDPHCTYYGTKEEKMDEKDFLALRQALDSLASPTLSEKLSREDFFALLAKHEKDLDETLALGEKSIANLRMYGSLNWYDWAKENWGTKWNAALTSVEDKALLFSTAWEPPLPLIVEISKAMPEEPLAFLFADEEIGYHVGFMLLTGGRIDEAGSFKDGSADAFKLAFSIYGNQNEFCFDKKKGTYVRL